MASIQGVYIALFGRPADPLGLGFFNSATNNGANLTAIGDLASTAEYQNRFTGQSTTQIITTIYRSLFNRDPDLAGLTFFSTALANKTLSINNIAIAIFDGAQGADITIRDLKVAAANAFTAQIDTVAEINGYTGTAAAASGVAFITGVTTTAPTAEQVAAAVVTATTQPQVGRTVTLTNNVDGPGAIEPAINTDGTSGNDVYLASNASLTGDFIDAKGGTDTLRLTAAANTNASLTSVERVETLAAANSVVTLSGSTGITTLVSSGGTANLTYTGIAAIADIEATGIATGDFTVNYAAAATSGTADVQKVALNGMGLSSAVGGTLTVNGVETFDITATGANRLAALVSDKVETVKVAGAGGFRVDGALANTVKTFDGSAATGAIRVGFTAGADVNVKTGTANDRVDFAGGLTSKDVIDLGTGTDTLVVTGADISAAASEVLKGINAAKGVETLAFTGAAAATATFSTLTNAGITKIVVDTSGATNDAISNIGTQLIAVGTSNAGNLALTLAGAGTTLGLNLEGSAKTAADAFNDADVGTVSTGAALTVNLASTGATDAVVDLKAINAADFNNAGVVTAVANATFNVTGDANTAFAGFTNAVNLQAGALTGSLSATGSASDDIIVGGTKGSFISAANGIDNIDISKSNTVAGDIIDLNGILVTANRDTVAGFQAGAGGDLVRIGVADTTAATAAAGTLALQEVTSNTGTTAFNTATNDLLEFNIALTGTTLAASNGAAALNGTNLLALVGAINVSANNDKGYIVAYQGGNAYVYHADDAGGNGALAAAEIQLVGVFSGVEQGGFATSNFLLV